MPLCLSLPSVYITGYPMSPIRALRLSLFPSLLFLFPLNLLSVFSPKLLRVRFYPVASPLCFCAFDHVVTTVLVVRSCLFTFCVCFCHRSFHFLFEADKFVCFPFSALFPFYFYFLKYFCSFFFSLSWWVPYFPWCLSCMCFFRSRSALPVMFSCSPSLSMLFASPFSSLSFTPRLARQRHESEGKLDMGWG